MAKVTMPLLSGSASGKIGDAIVFFPWKGIDVVREWIKPTNPQSANQGVRRVIVGGLGRSAKPAASTSNFVADASECAVAPQTWISTFVSFIAKNYMSTKSEFEAEYDEYAAHTAKTTFDSDAATLGLTTFDLPYAGLTKKFTAGLQLYETAKYGCVKHAADATKFNRAPYTTALASWVATNVNAHTANFAAIP